MNGAMLLPMDEASAREQSLTFHLALVACREGYGNSHLFGELMRAVYLAWFLQQEGYGSEPVGPFKPAERAVEDVREVADQLNEWVLAEDAVRVFERLLTLHDSQLATAPLRMATNAKCRLGQILAGRIDTTHGSRRNPCNLVPLQG